jgi:formyltetrahydrofolate deformylase
MASARLLLSCPDQRGLVARVAHTDDQAQVFFQRVEFLLDDFDLDRGQLSDRFGELAERCAMSWRVRYSDEPRRVAIMVSRQGHCLYDLLARWRAGELPGEIVAVISNWGDHAAAAEHFGIPFHELPVTPATRPAQEAAVMALLARYDVELVVLARYMQILSPTLTEPYGGRIINIHHSFLPAFAGGRPYAQAHERGVKLIGATAHYATATLDEGPIIDQDVVRISHRDSVEDLARKGRDLETTVLARAVRAHLTDRGLIYGGKTVVFD